jgi:TonB dependent receptor
MRNKINILVFGFCFLGLAAIAQDSSKKQKVEITSAFKPVLKNAVKINFNATPPAPEESKPNLSYNIPVQNLFFNLQPVALKPLALQIDSAGMAHNSNYIKLGYGNFNSPLADAGFTIGDGKKTNFNLFANHLSQNGKLRLQQFSNTSINAHLNTLLNKVEVYGKAGYQQKTFYLYGTDTSFINTKEDSLKKPYQIYTLRAGLRNAFVNKFGLSYNPDININVFNDSRASETNAVLDAPVEVRVGDKFGALVRANIDLTSFTPTGGSNYTNNVIFINPALIVKTSKLRLKAGIKPTWDNGKFRMLPDVLLDFPTQEGKAVIIAGWTGTVRKNTYQFLATENPWINQPLSQFNTRITQLYGGLKGSISGSFNYRLQAGYTEFINLPLFVNNIKPVSVFTIRNEQKLQSVHAQAELGLVLTDQLNAAVKADVYNFINQQTEAGPWHVLPLQLSAALRWQPIKKVMFKTDLFAWRGARYLVNAANNEDRLPSVVDLNAGIEFRVTNAISVWTQFNNIFNQSYQRWNNYPQLGFQFFGGIRFTFDQKL